MEVQPVHMKLRTGVTLVEFIVAVGLLALVFVFMVQLLPYSHVVNHQAWNLATAQDVAHTEMEAVRGYQIDYLYQAPSSGATTDPRFNTPFTWTMTAMPYPTPPPPPCPPCQPVPINLEMVTVQVDWTETGFSSAGVGGVPKQIVLRSLVSRVLPPEHP